MALDTKKGLSMSDFGEIVRKVTGDDGKFSYALIRYGGGVCMINSEQWFEFFENSTVVPGSVEITQDYIVTYERDESGARVMGEDGKPKLKKTDKIGWQVTAAKGLHQLKNESKTKIEVGTLAINEKTAMLSARNDYNRALKEAENYLSITPEMRERIEAHLLDD